MGKNTKKKFIDKKNAITFHLVHRSQKDPLLVDENAPQHVLKPANTGKNKKDKVKQLEEQHKYGIYFDDEYDYLQHLRDPNETTVVLERVFIPAKDNKTEITPSTDASSSSIGPNLQLPSSVFESHVEEKVGLLNKAAPESGLRLDLDPDIVAAMDKDFNFDDPNNLLEDNFIQLANGENGGDYEDGEMSVEDGSDQYEDMSSGFDEDEDEDQFDEDGLKMFMNEETKSRFTEYSMSSSVIRRNENLTYLDDTFEQMFAKYDDTEIGALECEEIEGDIVTDDERLLRAAEEFEKAKELEKFSQEKLVTQYTSITEQSSDSEDEDEYERMVVKEKEKWDCESILSTYSNIYNHPTLISEPKKMNRIKINPKTGIPITGVGGVGSQKLTASLLAHHDDLHECAPSHRGPGSIISAISTLSLRPKNESPQDRLIRKKNLKDFRKERRIEKKANKLAFKDEKKKMEREFVNRKVQTSAIRL